MAFKISVYFTIAVKINSADVILFNISIAYGPDEELPEVKCSPHLTVVQVGRSYDAVSFEPAYVKVERCIGKALPRTKCVPAKSHYRYVKVQKFIGDKQDDTCVVPIREDLKCQLVYIKPKHK